MILIINFEGVKIGIYLVQTQRNAFFFGLRGHFFSEFLMNNFFKSNLRNGKITYICP